MGLESLGPMLHGMTTDAGITKAGGGFTNMGKFMSALQGQGGGGGGMFGKIMSQIAGMGGGGGGAAGGKGGKGGGDGPVMGQLGQQSRNFMSEASVPTAVQRYDPFYRR